MDNLISLFGKSIIYVKNNNGQNLSFELTNEFYSYLDDISKRAKDLKLLSSKKKSKEEELKIKEKEDSESKYYLKIETLKKTLDLGAYKEMNQDLTKRIMEINDNSNRIIEEKNKNIEEYKNIINGIEQKFSKLEKFNYAFSEKVSKMKGK